MRDVLCEDLRIKIYALLPFSDLCSLSTAYEDLSEEIDTYKDKKYQEFVEACHADARRDPRGYRTPSFMVHAAKNNDLDILKRAFRERLKKKPVSTRTYTVNVYDKESGGPGQEVRVGLCVMPEWNACVCLHAAKHGNLDMLRWARSRDPPCPWDSRTCAYAKRNGHDACYEWAVENGAPLEPKTHIGDPMMDDMVILY
ncbi:MAG: hypothetical protein CMI16_02615 [Opitutaceae bacterium]|nr:hypothetical protein [Opitutaceae bacterium]